MHEFVPGLEYERKEVRRAFGSSKVDDDILVSREGVALIATIGPGSDKANFPDRSTLHWPGQVPKRAVERNSHVLVFVAQGGDALRFIGAGRVASYSSGKGLPLNVHLALTPRLKRAEWLELIAGQPPPQGPAPEEQLAN